MRLRSGRYTKSVYHFPLVDGGGQSAAAGRLEMPALSPLAAEGPTRQAGGPGKEAAAPTVPTHGVELVVAKQPHLLAQPGLVSCRSVFGASLPSLQSWASRLNIDGWASGPRAVMGSSWIALGAD